MTTPFSETSTGLVALAGLCALWLAGSLGFPVGLAGVVGVLLAPFVRPWLSHRLPWGLTSAAITGLSAVLWATGLLDAAAACTVALVALQVETRLARASSADDRMSALIATLSLGLAALLTRSPLFLVCVVVWGGGLPVVLMSAALAEGRHRGLSRPIEANALRWAFPLAALAVGAAVFLVLPRLRPDPGGSGEPMRSEAATGFAPGMELGAADALVASAAPVFEVRADGPFPEGPLYFRGMALVDFDGRSWKTDADPGPAAPDWTRPGEGPVRRFQVAVEPMPEPVAFVPGGWTRVVASGGLTLDGQGNLRLLGDPSQRHGYVVEAQPPFGSEATGEVSKLSVAELARLTRLPSDLDPRVGELAESLSGEASDPASIVGMLRDGLLSGWTYTWEPRDANVEDPLARFLFERKRGHCEYFASSLATLARSRGVAARVVEGFVVEAVPGEEVVVVARRDAHAWVEFHDGSRWRSVDATPGAAVVAAQAPWTWRAGEELSSLWYDGVLDYDMSRQTGLLLMAGWGAQHLVTGESTSIGVPWIGATVVVVSGLSAIVFAMALGMQLLRRASGPRRKRPSGRVARMHAKARRELHRRGWRVPAVLPPVAAAEWVRARAGEEAQPLVSLAWLSYRVRYGGEEDALLAEEARGLLRRVREIGPP